MAESVNTSRGWQGVTPSCPALCTAVDCKNMRTTSPLSYTHLSLPAPMAAVATPCCSPGRGARRRWCRSRSGPNLATFFYKVQERRKRAGLQWLLFARGVPALTSPLRCCSAQRYHEKVEKRSRSRALSLCSATTTCWAEKSEAGFDVRMGGGDAQNQCCLRTGTCQG